MTSHITQNQIQHSYSGLKSPTLSGPSYFSIYIHPLPVSLPHSSQTYYTHSCLRTFALTAPVAEMEFSQIVKWLPPSVHAHVTLSLKPSPTTLYKTHVHWSSSSLLLLDFPLLSLLPSVKAHSIFCLFVFSIRIKAHLGQGLHCVQSCVSTYCVVGAQ